MPSKKLLFETGTKKIYEGNSENQLILSFTDTVVTLDGGENGKVRNKASMSNAISTVVFEYLESYNILTHFIAKDGEKEMIVKNMDLLPLDIIVANGTDKDLSKRFGFKDGEVLESPVIEYYFESEKLKKTLVNDSHLTALGIISQEDVYQLGRSVAKVNAVLKSFFERRGLFLAKIHLRFGMCEGSQLLGNEVSPDTCVFWKMNEDNSLDREAYQLIKVNSGEVYKNLYNLIAGGV
ncbi:MAG: hypothetical protein E4H13_00030 [Calditrichales bacterium]|nr:MAG: hypothetical protein E4H13_00030 [Calditrichales bacterium]